MSFTGRQRCREGPVTAGGGLRDDGGEAEVVFDFGGGAGVVEGAQA